MNLGLVVAGNVEIQIANWLNSFNNCSKMDAELIRYVFNISNSFFIGWQAVYFFSCVFVYVNNF